MANTTPTAQKPKPKDLPEALRKLVKKYGKLTLGNPRAGVKSDDILQAITNLDNNKSGVFKNSIELLKKIKGIDDLTSGAGVAGMAAQALTRALSRAGGDVSSLSTSDSTLQAAIDEANRRKDNLLLIEALIVDIKEHIAATVLDPTALLDELDAIDEDFQSMLLLDLTLLPLTTTLDLIDTVHQLCVIIDYHWDLLPEGYPLMTLILKIEEVFDALSFVGLEKYQLRIDVAGLATVMLASQGYVTGLCPEIADIAQRLIDKAAQEDEYDDVGELINLGIDAIYDDLLRYVSSGRLTVAQLQALIDKLIALLLARGMQKVFGSAAGNMLGNAPFLIPQIGKMVKQTVDTFFPKSINDVQKLKETLKKFTESQAKAEKKRAIVQGDKLVPNPPESPQTEMSGESGNTTTSIPSSGFAW